MVELGYALSSEEHRPNDLVRNARLAEEAGFSYALISDHYHPWIDRQGQSPFVWGVLGGIAHTTQRMRLGTGVTCPLIRTHPAIIAQAAATAADMMPGRFFLGVCTGENLNEHILANKWPPFDIRLEVLDEAIKVIRLLWQGGTQSYWGKHYTIEDARVYTLPEQLPPIMIAASGSQAAELAGRIGDGFISTAPQAELVEKFRAGGGTGKPCYGQFACCWARNEAEAKRIAFEWWPTAAVRGELSQDLRTPTHFEQACGMVKEEDVGKIIVCGPDPQRYLEQIKKYTDAGFDHVYVHQVGPDQQGFIDFYRREILPEAPRIGGRASPGQREERAAA